VAGDQHCKPGQIFSRSATARESRETKAVPKPLTALLAQESKPEMAKSQKIQQTEVLHARMNKARITDGIRDSGVKLLEEAEADGIKKDENTKLERAIKSLRN
jgi:hypothetical protein